MKLWGKIIPKNPTKHCLRLIMAVIFIFTLTHTSYAQQATDSLKADTLKLSLDSLKKKDTTAGDSVAVRQTLADSLGIKISPDALPDVVTAEAKDSAILNMTDKLFYLYGKAKVNYDDLQLTAGIVSFDNAKNTVTAAPSADSAIAATERPTFTQGQEKFTYDSMQYNFKSKRAIVRNTRTQYGEGHIFSEQVKRNPDQSIYGLHSVYTTCALDTPHFGIYARRIKVIPNRIVASGPANMGIEQVPTPLFFPFGLFPITQGHRSGFVLPTYIISPSMGLGLLNSGYYFSVTPKIDMLLQADIYSKGGWQAVAKSTYKNRYHYEGSFTFNYAYTKIGEVFESGYRQQKDFKVRWTHHSDPKSRPGIGFNASLDAGTSTFNQNQTYDANQIMQNQFQSNISYSKNWQNRPFSLVVAARHSQVTSTRLVQVTLPEINFNVAQFNPLKSKNSVGIKWYDKISVSYTLAATNQTSFYDSSFSLNKLSMNHFNSGILQTVPINASYTVLRFLQMSFNTTYKEYWMTKRMYKYYDAATGMLDTNLYRGFYTARDFNAGVQFNTRIYGLKMFKKGTLAGIRHELRPNAGFTYTPDFAASPFHYGYKTITERNGQPVYLSAYEGNIQGTPGYNQFGKFGSLINFGLDNNLQIKVRNRRDSTGFKNIKLIDNFSITSSYKLSADSFQWNPISMNFANNLFNIINFRANATFDPYNYDKTTGRRYHQTMWQQGHGIARFVGAGANVGATFRSKQKTDAAKKTTGDEVSRLLDYGRYNDYVDFDIPWTFNFSYTLQIDKEYRLLPNSDTVKFSHSAMFGGDINLSPKWKLSVQSGYNFTFKQLTLTQLNIYRDLHCWEMRFSSVPFGRNKNFTFTINVKAAVLQDLKLVRQRNFRDSY